MGELRVQKEYDARKAEEVHSIQIRTAHEQSREALYNVESQNRDISNRIKQEYSTQLMSV